MKELRTIEDFKELESGQKVTYLDRDSLTSKTIPYIGKQETRQGVYFYFGMGGSRSHLWLSKREPFNITNSIRYFIGDYDRELMGNLLVKELESRIESVKKIYKL